MFEQLKEAMQSGKEQAMVNGIISMFGAQINAIKPENDIAQFIDEAFPAVFVPDESHKGDFDAMTGMAAKLLVQEANENPQHAVKKLMDFHNKFSIWYKERVYEQQREQTR